MNLFLDLRRIARDAEVANRFIRYQKSSYAGNRVADILSKIYTLASDNAEIIAAAIDKEVNSSD